MRSLAETKAQWLSQRPPAALAAQHASIHHWRPLQDALIGLWLQAVPGEPPRLHPSQPSNPALVQGGLPAPETLHAPWMQQARTWLHAHDELVRRHPPSRRYAHASGHFVQMRQLLQHAAQGQALSEAQRQHLRFMLACHLHAHGLLGSAPRAAWRARQHAQTAVAWKDAWAQALLARVSSAGEMEDIDGLADIAPLLAPAQAHEAGPHLPAGATLLPGLARQVRRLRMGSLDSLVAEGVVTSCEEMARLLPASAAAHLAATMPDAASARLLAALWRAFRQRRSLLLLDHASQVRFHELPWVRALLAIASPSGPGLPNEQGVANAPGESAVQAAADQALNAAARLALHTWPYAPLPNSMLWELDVFARAMGWRMPWVEEVAADIFLGKFSPKFAAAACLALPWLQGSLYARYYQIDLPGLQVLATHGHEAWIAQAEGRPEAQRENDAWFAQHASVFSAWLSPPASGARVISYVARNGATIERMLIVTTANLAPLAQRFGWGQAGDEDAWQRAAEAAFAWIAQHLSLPTVPGESAEDLWRMRLRRAAVAWRNLVFFLSLLPAGRQKAVLHALQASRPAAGSPAHVHLQACLHDLAACASGRTPAGKPWQGWQV